MLKDDEIQGKFFTRILMSVLLLPVLALYLLILHWITGWLVDEGETFHWFPIVLSAAAFAFAGALAGLQSFKTTHWTKETNGHRYWLCHPVGKTEAEVDAFVKKNFKKDEFASSDLTVVIAFLVFDLIVLGVGVFLSTHLLNALVAFPLWVITALLCRLPTGAGYIRELEGDDWKEYLCPHCGAICGKFDYKTTNRKDSSWIGSRQVKVTDKYTNGVDTVWVDRTETRYTLNENTSFDKIYTCSRCKKTHVKKFSYTHEV